jgi:hypothetical protein
VSLSSAEREAKYKSRHNPEAAEERVEKKAEGR